MLLQIRSAEFRYSDVTIFKNVNLDVNEGNSIGLVGANGAGKSTLLGCIVDELQLFEGNITRKNGLTVGYLKQNCDFVSSNTLFDEMMSVFAYQTQLVEQIREIAEQMASCDFDSIEYKVLADKYHRLTVEADVTEAYQCEVKVKTVLNGMGMTEFSNRVVSTLSGGEKTKAALCKLLLQRPELMILDEPTNHLDYKTLDWLETFLSDKKSTLLVVSHDRYFLDKLCDTIWDVQHQSVTAYNGNYTKYKLLKAERQENERRAYERQQREIAKLTDYIQRNKVRASTADMAKSRENALNKMERFDAPKSDERPPRFKFGYSSEPSEFPLTIQRLTLGYDGKQLLNDGELQIRRGQKVALLGLNGVGKSTLIRRIASQNPQDYGKIVFGKNVRMGYYDQENINLQANLRVIDQLWFDNTRMSQTEVRNLLAQVTLGADDVYKQVGDLSGGERAKLGIAMIMAKDCNLLLLDEPTNHLDLPSREALEEALKSYTGTLLYVSHDRYFVNSVSNVIAELNDCKLTVYEGNYDDFLNRKNTPSEPVKPVAKPAQSTYRNAKQRADETNRAKKIKELEKRITELEMEVEQLNGQMALPEIAADYSKLSQVMERLKQANAELEQTLSEWENLA
ncbi:MAG: ABC-F family ATP-binding cassette domain-containing protein [Clostridiales bacterium]|nr:ABC-F family ATP-binding cassette domain-containing protein [Clostridiales bacterium]